MAMRRTYSQVKFVNWVVFLLSVVISVAIVIFTTVIKKMGLFPEGSPENLVNHYHIGIPLL